MDDPEAIRGETQEPIRSGPPLRRAEQETLASAAPPHLGETRTRSAVDRGASAARLSPGEHFGAYRIRRQLGAGGMGVVYAAYHSELDREVALKLVHDDLPPETAGRAMVLREAQALARLSHPNVVQIYEVGEVQGQVFIAMELVDGVPLGEWLSTTQRRLGEIVNVFHQAALGLHAAHEAGLIHRDFKPANAIVGADGRVRVLDFGLAQERPELGADALADALEASAHRLTESLSGPVAGTPAYMSPEQFTGERLDARSDVFSFAVALWEGLYAERPFAAETIRELQSRVIAGEREVPPPGVALPERLRRALERSLEPSRERRWSSMQPLIDALAGDPDADPSAAARERRILFAVVSGVVFLLVLPMLILGRADEVDRRVVLSSLSLTSLLLIVSLSLLFRDTLLRNIYHRRLLLFIAALFLVVTSQRTLGLLRQTPIDEIVAGSAHVFVGMHLAGAIFFARWLLVPALLVVVAAAAALSVPGLYPNGLLVLMPSLILTYAYFWRRAGLRPAPSAASDR